MKKILLLGGSAQQVIAIETAKRLGYYTVLCDYLADNPGQYVADKFYLASTTDKKAVLDIAKKEEIQGVLAYASDPAAPTAAYVASQLGLHSNSCEAVETLCNKDRFRTFLATNGFNAPRAEGYTSKEAAIEGVKNYSFPIIIKPVDSSGSKGVTVLHSLEGMKQAVDFAFSYSRSHRIIVEEFIEKKHQYLIGGDVFVVSGKIVLWGLMNCHRDESVNPLVPVGKSYPLKLDDSDIQQVKNTLQRLVTKLQINSGALNVELVVDKNGKVWPIDVGPRCGGNMIPELLGYIFGIDIVEMSVKIAMGEKVEINISEEKVYYATHNLHAKQSGSYVDIKFAPELEKYIIKKFFYKKKGEPVEYFNNAANALGIIFLKFENQNKMDEILENINKYINVEIEKKNS